MSQKKNFEHQTRIDHTSTTDATKVKSARLFKRNVSGVNQPIRATVQTSNLKHMMLI
jgi:hypothetical protein